MATSELLDLLALDSSTKSGNSGLSDSISGPPTKQRRIMSSAVEFPEEEKWSLEKMWDYSSQYEEQNSVEIFLKTQTM
jgi:hypothetical protein